MKKILLAVVSISLVNCASSNFTSTNETDYSEYKGVVKVFFDEPGEIEYDEVGIVAAEGSFFGDDVQVIKLLQKKAAKEGANAIIIMSAFSGTQVKTQKNDSGVHIYGDDGKKMLAVAIRIKEE